MVSQTDRRFVRSGSFAGARDGRDEDGTVALDGTKIRAIASRHSALTYEHAGKTEAQLKGGAADLLAKAEAADRADIPDGLSLPEELALQKDRLLRIAAARPKIEARAQERYARELGKHEATLAARTAATGRASSTQSNPQYARPSPKTAVPNGPKLLSDRLLDRMTVV